MNRLDFVDNGHRFALEVVDRGDGELDVTVRWWRHGNIQGRTWAGQYLPGTGILGAHYLDEADAEDHSPVSAWLTQTVETHLGART